MARQVAGDGLARLMGEGLAGQGVDALGHAEFVGHEVVEPDVDRAVRADGVAVAHQRAEHLIEAVDPGVGDLFDWHRRAVHARGVGDHRDHRQRHRHRIAVGEHDDAVGEHPIQHRHLFEVLRRLEQPAPPPAQELHRPQLGGQVFVVRRLVVGLVVVAPAGHVGERLQQHRGDVVGQQLDLLVDVVGGHFVHEREMRHHRVDHPDRDVHPGPPRIRLHANLVRHREGLVAFPVRHGAEGGWRRQQVVQVRGAGAGQPGDHHGRGQFDVVDLGMAPQQVGQQQPVLQDLQQLPVEVDRPGAVQPVDLAQRGEEDVEPFAVVVGPEIVQAGVRTGLGVQRVGVQRALRGHRAHHVEDLLTLGAESGRGQVIEGNGANGIGHGDLCYSQFRNGW